MLQRPPDPPNAKRRRRERKAAYERRVRRGEWKLRVLITERMRHRLVELRQLTQDDAADRDIVERTVNELLAEALK
jgi:hypothetical protein